MNVVPIRHPVFETARLALATGMHPIPILMNGTKAPALRWAQYQKRQATEAEVEHWFRDGEHALGLVMGRDVECVDFDSPEAFDEFTNLAHACELGELWDRIRDGYTEQTPGGFHVVWRCEEVEGNLKLARERQGDAVKVHIETRGEGGYIVAAPSAGSTHQTGRPYEMVSGGLQSIVSVSPDERRELLTLARSLDRCPAPSEDRFEAMTVSGDRPGDEWAAQATWREILEPHGWKRLFVDGEKEVWRRPGKKRGISATTNFDGSGLLYVFSTSTVFEAERGYGKFGAFALLEHDGDHKAAARELARRGFGGELAPEGRPVDISALLAPPPLPKPQPDEHAFPRHLLDVPGLVGDLQRYIVSASDKPQPILALGASIAALAAVMGRKVRTDTDLRPNLYVVGVGESGCGKENARRFIRRVLDRSGHARLHQFDDMSSDAAINTAIAKSPSALFLLDEIGIELQGLADARSPAHVRAKVSAYLKLYGASAGTYFSKSYADAERQEVVEQPNLCIYGTTVPGSLWDSITTDQIEGGLLSRFLVFESEDPDPVYRKVLLDDQQPPEELLEELKGWAREGDLSQHVLGARPSPRTVSAWQDAEEVFSKLEERMRARRAELRAEGGLPSLFTRVVPAAWKLALIRACGRNRLVTAIDTSDAQWACELAEYCAEHLAWRIATHAADDVYQKAEKLMLEQLAKHHGCVKRSTFWRGLRRAPMTDPRVREAATKNLLAREELFVVTTKADGRGRPAVFYLDAAQYAARVDKEGPP